MPNGSDDNVVTFEDREYPPELKRKVNEVNRRAKRARERGDREFSNRLLRILPEEKRELEIE